MRGDCEVHTHLMPDGRCSCADRRGNCYVATEAAYHILGGKRSGWKPMVTRTTTDTHWFLRHKTGLILDLSRKQFRGQLPDYTKAKGCGFLTRKPSKRAAALIEKLTYQ